MDRKIITSPVIMMVGLVCGAFLNIKVGVVIFFIGLVLLLVPRKWLWWQFRIVRALCGGKVKCHFCKRVEGLLLDLRSGDNFVPKRVEVAGNKLIINGEKFSFSTQNNRSVEIRCCSVPKENARDHILFKSNVDSVHVEQKSGGCVRVCFGSKAPGLELPKVPDELAWQALSTLTDMEPEELQRYVRLDLNIEKKTKATDGTSPTP